VRNNYYQPAMRELMAHSVSVWERDPEATATTRRLHADQPEVMHAQVGTIYEQQKAIGYESVSSKAKPNRCATCRDLPRLAGEEHHVGAARKARRLREQHGVDARPRGEGDGTGRRDRHRRRR
jgi:hypothetical protein